MVLRSEQRPSKTGAASSTRGATPDSGPPRVLLLHPERLHREALAVALSGDRRIGRVRCGDGTRRLPDSCSPDVVVVDLGLPGGSGIAETRLAQQCFPQARVLVTGCSELESEIVGCIEAGASGCLLTGASLEELIVSIRAVGSGRKVCSPRIADVLFTHVSRGSHHSSRLGPAPLIRLTPRELEVIQLIDDGKSNKEIARALEIRPQTVKNHVHNILEKLQVKRRDDAARFARDHGLLPGESRAASAPGRRIATGRY